MDKKQLTREDEEHLIDLKVDVLHACGNLGCPSRVVASKYSEKVDQLLRAGWLPADVAREVCSIAAKEQSLESPWR